MFQMIPVMALLLAACAAWYGIGLIRSGVLFGYKNPRKEKRVARLVGLVMILLGAGFAMLAFEEIPTRLSSVDRYLTKTGEEDQIDEVFQEYRTALILTDGPTAADFVSRRTIDAYERYGDLAVSGDKRTVKSLTISGRMHVLSLRHWIDHRDLKEMDGRDAFVCAVDNDWFGKDGVIRMGITEIAVHLDRASARITRDDRATGETMHFMREDGGWKIDLLVAMKNADARMRKAARENGLSEDEFLISQIGTLSGRKVGRRIWKPLD